jgi:ubiquinone/menaquinone biosynthesis C-methylase UbiE
MINQYFFEVFEAVPRQGPGSKTETVKAFNLADELPNNPVILDVGCGKGKQTLDLAAISDGHITAMDMHQPFLLELQKVIRKKNLQHRISTLVGDMASLPFVENQFDMIWAEGSIYIIGYHRAMSEWKKYLQTKGYLVFTDCVWMQENPPLELVKYWDNEGLKLPTINQIKEKAVESGYEVITHFTLSHASWRKEFYDHIDKVLEVVKQKYKGNVEAQDTFFAIDKEIEVFDKYHEYFGYEFFVLKCM